MENSLPQGWSVARLSDLADIIMGQSPPSELYNNEGVGLPFYQGKAEFTDLHPVVRKWCSNPNKIAQPNDILISVRAPVGPTNIANEVCGIGRGLAAIRYESCYKYVFYFLRSIEHSLEQYATGSTFTAISGDVLREISISVAPLAEQYRIVAKLDAVMQKVESNKQRLEQVPKILKRFRQSVLAAAMRGLVTEEFRRSNPGLETASVKSTRAKKRPVLDDKADDYNLYELPPTWRWLTISDVADVKGGKRIPKGESLVSYDTGFPYIKAGALKKGTILRHKLEYLLPTTREKIKRYTISKGDVYITNVGACIGDAGLVPDDFDGANLTENALKMCNLEGVYNQYFAYWLRSPIAQDFIQQTVLSAAQGKLALGRVEAFPLPLPSLKEQHEIVHIVERLFAFADKIEARYKKPRRS